MKLSRVLSEVHESALALYQSGAIDKRTMREFDDLIFPPVRELSPKQIRTLRTKSRMSQAVFAVLLNTSVSTVQKWEIGKKKPSGPSLKLLNIIQQKGFEALV
jgi:putative transcriptional regulator